jgi:hypothetical protein
LEIHPVCTTAQDSTWYELTFFVAAEADGTSELHKREFCDASGVDNDEDGDKNHNYDEGRAYEHDNSGGDAPSPSVQVSASAVPGVHAAPMINNPWATAATSNPPSTSMQMQTRSTTLTSHSKSITTPWPVLKLQQRFFHFCLHTSGSRGVHHWRQYSNS